MRLRYTKKSLGELQDILDSIAIASPAGAGRVKSRIHEVTRLIADFPQAGRATRNPRINRITASPFPYLVFYEIRQDAVVIIAVRHGARDPASMPDAP